MATTRISPNADEIISEIRIAAPRERVFSALTDPAKVPLWWGQRGVYSCKSFERELRPGGKWRSAGTGPDGRAFEVTGKYIQVDPPTLLEFSWIASWTGDAKTTVRYELEEDGGETLLRVRHMGLAAHPELREAYQGWPRMLGWIAAYVERGETVEDRPAAAWR